MIGDNCSHVYHGNEFLLLKGKDDLLYARNFKKISWLSQGFSFKTLSRKFLKYIEKPKPVSTFFENCFSSLLLQKKSLPPDVRMRS